MGSNWGQNPGRKVCEIREGRNVGYLIIDSSFLWLANCQTKCNGLSKILHMGFHNLTLCEDVDLTAFGSVQRPVLYNYQYLFAWENIPGLIHLYSHLFHAVQANMDRANRQ